MAVIQKDRSHCSSPCPVPESRLPVPLEISPICQIIDLVATWDGYSQGSLILQDSQAFGKEAHSIRGGHMLNTVFDKNEVDRFVFVRKWVPYIYIRIMVLPASENVTTAS
jgi:hypothetical protein